MNAPAAVRITVGGRVQGVGYRPFVCRLARALSLSGWVRNRGGEVELLAEGAPAALERLRQELLQRAPPLARPRLDRVSEVVPRRRQGFVIRASGAARPAAARPDVARLRPHLPPDQAPCDACLSELYDPQARRYRYPFINCTQCGPRYTIIRALPYDRPATALSGFALCPACRAEYHDLGDRRCHAQPLACPDCGPRLSFVGPDPKPGSDQILPLTAAVTALCGGRIIAVKGVGGYHLLCDAGDERAVRRLRRRKFRPHKPLAVMFPARGADGLAAVERAVRLTAAERRLLTDPARPIVLARKRPGAGLAAMLAPGLAELGVLLPYSPLHHLLLDACNRPLVATSGNLGGEPVIVDEKDAASRLTTVADGFLHHDRPILRPADDPVLRVIAGRARPLRLGRGNAPLELDLPLDVGPPLLALGCHQKLSIALAWERRLVLSPHLGTLDTPRALQALGRIGDELQSLYGVSATRLLCDAHPSCGAGRWARRQTLPLTTVYHHHAHAAVIAGENPAPERWLVFTWDGVGYGPDGTLWGGETLYGGPGRWRRVARLRPFRPPGGERAGREPWRSAAALCWQTEVDAALPAPAAALRLARLAWQRDLNCPQTSAAGRLWDAAAALVCGCGTSSYEGQAAMQLEALAATCGNTDNTDGAVPALPARTAADGCLELDWAPLLPLLLDTRLSPGRRAAAFHIAISDAVVGLVDTLTRVLACDAVGLCGGVFQNRLLSERTVALLSDRGWPVHLPRRLPAGDAGLAYGQVIEWTAGRQQYE